MSKTDEPRGKKRKRPIPKHVSLGNTTQNGGSERSPVTPSNQLALPTKSSDDTPKGPKKTGNTSHDGPSQRFPNLSARAAALLPVRQALPIYNRRSDILSALSSPAVLLLSGETGSGKSTQVPQYLLSAPWCKGRIAVTQPRRVAAISLARRVAEELGTPLGKASPASKVGYSVRFDDNVGRGNQIKYLTEGMLLLEMLRDPTLKEYDVVVVDEVHERSVNVDLILGFLKELVSGRVATRKAPLRVVIMSATADIEKLHAFFNDSQEQTNDNHHHIATISVQGRQHPVKTIYLPEPVQDFSEAALKAVFQAHCKEPMPGDILVFLTGQDTVQTLQKSIEEYAEGLTSAFPKLLVLPLFAALPQAAQQRVFDPAPPHTRKVILATNIAETSITVPGVRFVIDCGKAKIKQFRTKLGLDSLLVKPISQSSAIQRQGRAGREAPGKCWRLYTEKDYSALDKAHTPEILRCDLASAVLVMKANGVRDVLSFPLLSPPSQQSLARALLALLSLGALDEDGSISTIGSKMARLPLTPALGRVIIAAAELDADRLLLPTIDIVASLSVENIFLVTETEEAKEEAMTARQALFRRQGDHLTLLAAVRGYAAENTDRKAWAERHLINHRAMQSVMDVRKQLRAQCRQAGLLPDTAIALEEEHSALSEVTAGDVLKCFLRGFSSNVARLVPDGSYRTLIANQTVAIHPSSVLFGRKVEAIMYNEFVFTNRSYARNVSVVRMDWVDDVYAA